jgi:outer membrane protein TolC
MSMSRGRQGRPSCPSRRQYRQRLATSSAFDDARLAAFDQHVASDVAIAQQLPWGTSYRVGWTGGRRSNSSALARFRPELSAAAGITLIQPLLKGLTFDAARATHDVSQRNRDIAAADLDGAVASTRYAVLSAHWSWVYRRELLDGQRQSLSLAETLLEGNQRRIAVGAMASVDAIEAEAEVARLSRGSSRPACRPASLYSRRSATWLPRARRCSGPHLLSAVGG